MRPIEYVLIAALAIVAALAGLSMDNDAYAKCRERYSAAVCHHSLYR